MVANTNLMETFIDSNFYTMLFLDAYPTQHLVFNWKSPSLVVLDKEMAQFYMNEMSTTVGRTQYVAGE